MVVRDHRPYSGQGADEELAKEGSVSYALRFHRDFRDQHFSEAIFVYPHSRQEAQLPDAGAPADLR
jgi:hypothetical protein